MCASAHIVSIAERVFWLSAFSRMASSDLCRFAPTSCELQLGIGEWFQIVCLLGEFGEMVVSHPMLQVLEYLYPQL